MLDLYINGKKKMKRSEMVDKLYQELIFWDNRHSKYRTVSSPLKKELADILLQSVEDTGMLPPCENCINNLDCDYYCQGAGVWEKEDEKK